MLVVIPTALAVVNAQRNCVSPTFGLPMNCDTGWITTVVLVLIAVTVLAEVVLGWPRSRPCPRCGSRVRTGTLVCPRCEFDFRAVGAPTR